MNSLEKLHNLLQGASTIVPDDEEAAKLVQMLQMAGPMIGPLIPDSADELDAMLASLAHWAVKLRSDECMGLEVITTTFVTGALHPVETSS